MFCNNCKTPLSDNSRFCHSCGSPVLSEAKKPVYTNISDTYEKTEYTENPYAKVIPPESNQANLHPPIYYGYPAPEPRKINPFTFVSAAIMGIIAALYFFPWFFVDEKCVSLISYFLIRSYPEYTLSTAMMLFLVFTITAFGLLISGIVVAIIRKNRMPMVFAITSTVSVHLSMLFFVFTSEAWTTGVSFVPVLIFLLSFFNIAFSIPAKIK